MNLRKFLNSDNGNDIRDKLEKQNEFLLALIKYVRIGKAAKAAGVELTEVNGWRRDDLMFRQRFLEAQAICWEVLEDEAIRRGFKGVKVDIFNKNGDKTGETIKYSDNLLSLVLKARIPEYGKVDKPLGDDSVSQLLILPSNGTEMKELPADAQRFEIKREEELITVEDLVKRAKDDNDGIFEEKSDQIDEEDDDEQILK